MKIILTRVEGPSRDCGIPRTVGTFKEANRVLSDWSSTAPGRDESNEGGYDKVDFQITDPAIDLTYYGRYDLKHYHRERADLQGHVIGALEYRAELAYPTGRDESYYQGLIAARDHLKQKT